MTISNDDLRQLFLHSQEMLSIIRADGTFKAVNPMWTTVLGWQEPELVDVPYMRFVHPDDHEATRREAARLAAGATTIDFENRYRTKDGAYRWVSWRVTPSADASVLYCVTRDVTGSRQVQREMAQQSQALEQARAAAERANRAKSDFMSRMSHELRTPLNAMLGFAQLFDRSRLSEEDADSVHHILSGGRHLLNLINEVIDISRVESGTLALSPEAVQLDDAVGGAVEMMQPLAAERNLEVSVESHGTAGLSVVADRNRLRQVLLNLLSNAVKYNRPRGRIVVSTAVLPDRRLRIAVRDTGPGIPPALLAMLFQPFERLGAEKTETEGTGLGLTLSRALCEAMGGRLHVESQVDCGSTFTVELAQAEPPTVPDAPEASPPPAAPAAAGLVVYVEDNAANVRLIERILSRRPGLRLLHAADGRSGVALVRQARPDLVLLDLQLPEMPGEAVLKELWMDPMTRPIPVVVVTADATRGLPARLQSAGARACLTKPLDVQQVLRVLDQVMTEQEAGGD